MATSVSKSMDCSVCFMKYDTNTHLPKILPCHHTFCQQCIVGITKDGDDFNCPQCREPTMLPTGGVQKIPINLAVRDIVEEMPATPSSPALKCSTHPEKECLLYCVDCLKGLCSTCIKQVQRGPHIEHQLEDMDDLEAVLTDKYMDQWTQRNKEQHKQTMEFVNQLKHVTAHQKSAIEKVSQGIHETVDNWVKQSKADLQQQEEDALAAYNVGIEDQQVLQHMSVDILIKTLQTFKNKDGSMSYIPENKCGSWNEGLTKLQVLIIAKIYELSHAFKVTNQTPLQQVKPDESSSETTEDNQQESNCVTTEDSQEVNSCGTTTEIQQETSCGTKEESQQAASCGTTEKSQLESGITAEPESKAKLGGYVIPNEGTVAEASLPVHQKPSKKQQQRNWRDKSRNRLFHKVVHDRRKGKSELICLTDDFILIEDLNMMEHEMLSIWNDGLDEEKKLLGTWDDVQYDSDYATDIDVARDSLKRKLRSIRGRRYDPTF